MTKFTCTDDQNTRPFLCDSYTVTVSSGHFRAVVPPRDAIAILVGRSPGNGTDTSHIPRNRPTVSVDVVLLAPAELGQVRPHPPFWRSVVSVLTFAPLEQEIVIVGSSPRLGSWDTVHGVRLQMEPLGTKWTARVDLYAAETVKFKFVKLGASGELDAWG